jgi:hypothetical protein
LVGTRFYRDIAEAAEWSSAAAQCHAQGIGQQECIVLTAFLPQTRRGKVCGADIRLQAGMDERAFIFPTSERPKAQQWRDTARLDDPLPAARAYE